MTIFQKENITLLRGKGKSYAQIADSLGISENTVKSYCRRNNLGAGYVSEQNTAAPVSDTCGNCGRPFEHTARAKRRRFCSDKCRLLWWKTHPESMNRKAVYQFSCAACGAEFESYGNAKRRYCSHNCYISDRFGK